MTVKMILTNAFDPDPRVLKEAKALIKIGYDVEILCWDRDNRFINKPIEVIDGIKVKRFFPKSEYGSGFNQLQGYFQFAREVRNYLNFKDFDIVHAHDIDGMLVGSFIKNKKKLIWDMHEFYNGFNYGKLKSVLYELIAKFCFKKADAIIFVSESQKHFYRSKLKKGTNIEVIMNSPEEDIFDNFVRQESKKLRISFIGSVRDYNSLKVLMDVCESFESVIANINGMGIAYEELNQICVNYKNSNVTGRFSYYDIKKYYENTDIIYAVYDDTHLNVKHAFPVKGLEAIYTETPVIASKNTDFGAFVDKYDIGFTVNYGNEENLKSILCQILANEEVLYDKIQNIKKIKKSYLWNQQREKLENFYKNL